MAEFYKILKADPLGDPWTPNMPGAKPIQNFWCQVEGEELPVSIGKQVGNTLTPGQNVYGDLMKARSSKGNDYWKFKSAKVPDDVQRPADSAAPPTSVSGEIPGWFMPYGNMITDTYKMVKELHGGELQDEPETPKEEAKPVEQVSGEPLSEEDQTMLDDIFGGEKEPSDV